VRDERPVDGLAALEQGPDRPDIGLADGRDVKETPDTFAW
jgi:hypothetical protein